MNNKAKTSIFFVILLLLISLGSAGFYFFSYTNEKNLRSKLQEELNLVKDEKDKIKNQLEAIKNEKIFLENKVKENEAIISDFNEKFAKEIQAKDLLINEQQSLQLKISELEQEKNKIQTTLNDKLKELLELQNRLDTVLKKRYSQVEELEKIVVTPSESDLGNDDTETFVESSLSSKVILINREYDFLVINIGKNSGVEIGDIFEIIHENESLGNVRVEQVRDVMSAANFQEGFKKDLVSEGDIANRIN